MVQINFAQKTVTAKIVYYGPGMSGKTTNLEVVHQRAPDQNRGQLTSISTDGDRTLFFDFMPLDLGTVAGMRTCFQIYTVPGQVYYNSTRKLVLQGVDGVVFVADSAASMTEENMESLRNLEENLTEYGKSLVSMPHVIQFNKRDLPDALPVDELNGLLNRYGAPTYEAVANVGQGVFPTLKALAAKVLESIHSSSGAAASHAPPAPQPVVEGVSAAEMHAPMAPPPQAPPAIPEPTVGLDPQLRSAPAASLEPPSPLSPHQMGVQPAPTPHQMGVQPAPTLHPTGVQPAPPMHQTGVQPAPTLHPTGIPPAPPPAGMQPGEPQRLELKAPVQQAPTGYYQRSAVAQGAPVQQPPPSPGQLMQPDPAAGAAAPRAARPPATRPAPGPALPGTRFRPRGAARPTARPTPVARTRGGGNAVYTGVFVALAVAVAGVLVKVILSFF